VQGGRGAPGSSTFTAFRFSPGKRNNPAYSRLIHGQEKVCRGGGGSPSGMRRAPSGMKLSELTLLSLLGCFRFPGLDLLFRRLPRRNATAAAVHLPGHHVTSFRPFRFSLLLNVGTRRCNALRSPAGAGTPGSSSPPSSRSAPGASSCRREAVSSTLPR